MSSVRTVHTAWRSEIAPRTALTIRAGARTRRHRYSLCAIGETGSSGAEQWLSTNSAYGPIPMWVSTPSAGLVCAGQFVTLPGAVRDWVYLLVSTDTAATHEIWLHYRDAVDPEWLRVRAGVDGPQVVRLPLTRPEPPVALRLPEAAGLRLHAVTLLAPTESSDHGER
ncbi:MAG TPA: hypothetical protein VFW65_37520 [Pseudonocardiaceae bacterium]|nr:hypothetical protein [Pseudonocardiaceae bacterium]